MVSSRICEDSPMTCEGENCFFDTKPDEEFPYFGKHRTTSYECLIKKMTIIAKDQHTSLFVNSNSRCLPKDGFCLLHNSIVIWNELDIRPCPYQLLSTLYEFSHNNYSILYSPKEHMLFKIVNSTQECGLNIKQTTSGLSIVLLSNSPLEAKERQTNLRYLSKMNATAKLEDKFHNKDIREYALSEEDYYRFAFANTTLLEFNQICSILKNQLEIMRTLKHEILKLNLLNGLEIIVLVQNNVMYQLKCMNVNGFVVPDSTSKCYKDFPIEIYPSGKRINAFLTYNGYIKSSSEEISCDDSNDQILLEGVSLTKNRNIYTIKRETHINYNKIQSEQVSYDLLNNFNHHKELTLDEFESNANQKTEKIETIEELNGGFYNIKPKEIIQDESLLDNVPISSFLDTIGKYFKYILLSAVGIIVFIIILVIVIWKCGSSCVDLIGKLICCKFCINKKYDSNGFKGFKRLSFKKPLNQSEDSINDRESMF